VPKIDFTTALARLLGNAALREKFATDPSAVAEQMGIRDEDRASLIALPSAELEFQAGTLLRKRFHEARKLAPKTFSQLGQESWNRFKNYADSHWPEGHQRHVLDALAFCEHLQTPSNSERNRLHFIASRRRLMLRWTTDLPGTANLALQILRRSRDGAIRESAIYFGLQASGGTTTSITTAVP
jgi:hypothetical protein